MRTMQSTALEIFIGLNRFFRAWLSTLPAIVYCPSV